MTRARHLDLLWLLLVLLTLGGAWLGEAAEPGPGVALAVSLTMAFKGRIVIDHFMELKSANPTLRRLMRAYFYLVPLATVLVYLLGEHLASLTGRVLG